MWLEFSSYLGSGAEATVDAPAAAGPCDYEGVGGPITSVTLTNGGSGYAQLAADPADPPLVAEVTVTVNQEPPGGGSGAVVTATVDDDTASPTFGQIIALTLVDGGDGYLSAAQSCDLPDRLYITWGDLEGEVLLKSYFETTWPGFVSASGIAWNDGGGNLQPQFYTENGGDYRGVCMSNYWPEDVGQTFSVAWGFITRNGPVGEFPVVECKCGGKLHMQLGLWIRCMQTAANSHYEVYGITHEWCVRFDVDESGCPVGDAVVIGTDWVAPDSELNPCDETCFDRVDPVVSFMPP